MPTDGETLKEEDEFIGFEYFIIKHTFQTQCQKSISAHQIAIGHKK